MSEEQPVKPEDMHFTVNGAQLNVMLAYLGRRPYEEVYELIDVIRSLKRVNLTQREERNEEQSSEE